MARRAKPVGSCWKVHEAFSVTSPVSRCRSRSKAARSCRSEMRSATDVPFARSGEKRASEGGAPGKLVGPDPTPRAGLSGPRALRKACTRNKGPDCSMSFGIAFEEADPRSQVWFRSCLGWVLPPLAFSPYTGRCSLHGAGPGGLQCSPDSGPVGPELSLGVPLDAQVPARGVQLQPFLFPAVPRSGPASTPRSPPLSPARPLQGSSPGWPPNLASRRSWLPGTLRDPVI